MTTLFRAFNRRSPADTDPVFTQMSGVRANLLALASAMVMGGSLPGWDYTNSVTRSESSPGTADQPAREYFSFATDRKPIWVRVANTFNASGYPTAMVFSISDDDETSYGSMGDLLNGYNKLTITYDASNNVTAMTWGAA